MSPWTRWTMLAATGGSLLGCRGSGEAIRDGAKPAGADSSASPIAAKVAQYTAVRLTADLAGLSDRERRMLPLLIEAASEMDTVYQQQYYPARDSLLASVQRPRHAPLHRDQLRTVGPARRGPAVRPRRGRAPRWRGALSARPDRRGVRASRRRLARGGSRAPRASTPSCAGTAPGALVAVPYHQAFAAPHADAQRPSSARPPGSPTTPASGGISSFAPGPSRPTTIGRATSRGWT